MMNALSNEAQRKRVPPPGGQLRGPVL